MKILIIEPIGSHGGNDIYNKNVVMSLKKQANIFFVNLITSSLQKDFDSLDIRQMYYRIYGKSNKFIRAFRYIKGTINALIYAKQEKVDIVHLHFFGFSVLEYLNLFLTKIFFSFKVVGVVHDVESFENDTKPNYKKFMSLIDGVVVHTEYARQELLKNIGSKIFDTSKIKTIYACDLEYSTLGSNQIDVSVARKRLNLPLDKKIILFFGQIKTVKGLEVLLNALAIACKKNNNLLLVVAGKVWKDDFSVYEKIITKHKLHDNVSLRIGFVDNEDVPLYFNAVDAIVLPYRKIYNSGVLIRAMSYATPIIASDFGPFKEFIKHNKNGLLFRTGDSEDLAKKILNAFTNAENLTNMGVEAKRMIVDQFSLNSIGKQYVNIYSKALKEEMQ
jgi:D-inositol-3-phosphate glycosyltransferase